MKKSTNEPDHGSAGSDSADNDGKYSVECIVDHKYCDRFKEWQLKIKWQDYPGEDSWEPLDNMLE